MAVVKAFHLLFLFIWIGNLLSLTRFMGYHVKEDETTQMRLARLYKRMYTFVGLPSMILAILMGTLLILQIDQEQGLTWFIFKLAFVFGLIGIDLLTGHWITEFNQKPDTSRGIRYKILHGICGLLLIAVIACVYIFR